MSFTQVRFGKLSTEEQAKACNRYQAWLDQNGCIDSCSTGCDSGCSGSASDCGTGCGEDGCCGTGCGSSTLANEYVIYNDSTTLEASIYYKSDTSVVLTTLMPGESKPFASNVAYIFQYQGDFKLFKDGVFLNETGATEFTLTANVHFSDGDSIGCGSSCSDGCSNGCSDGCAIDTTKIEYYGLMLHLCGCSDSGTNDEYLYNGTNSIKSGTYFVDTINQNYTINGMQYTENLWHCFNPGEYYSIDDNKIADSCNCGCGCYDGCGYCGSCVTPCGCDFIEGCVEECGSACSYGCGCGYKEEVYGCDCSYSCYDSYCYSCNSDCGSSCGCC